MVAGAMLESEDALRVGFVDELADVDFVVARALEWCRAHLALPHEALSETRRMARRDLHDELDRAEKAAIDAFVDRWFSDESQSVLKALVAKLQVRKCARLRRPSPPAATDR
jgi:enoyl-CoA hydratase/carnithine racemase